jgi:hypothetical protein
MEWPTMHDMTTYTILRGLLSACSCGTSKIISLCKSLKNNGLVCALTTRLVVRRDDRLSV